MQGTITQSLVFQVVINPSMTKFLRLHMHFYRILQVTPRGIAILGQSIYTYLF